jgi:hypothetical protein
LTDAARETKFVAGPESRIVVPDHEELITIRRTELQGLIRDCRERAKPSRAARDWAVGWAGIAAGLIAALIGTIGATEDPKPWLIPALAIGVAASLFLFGFCLWYSKDQEGREGLGFGKVAERLQEIESRHQV